MRILDQTGLDFDDVLLVPKRSNLSSRADVDLTREYKFLHCKRPLKCTGIIASNMYNIGTINMTYPLAKSNLLTALHKFHSREQIDKINNDSVVDGNYFLTIGESEKDLKLLHSISCQLGKNRLMVCIDVANAYRFSFVDYIKRIRDFCCEQTLVMAGNVTTPNLVEELISAGVDIVKIFIGPGSQCQTRKVTGVGYPTLTATIECADAAHGLNGHICADGGFKVNLGILQKLLEPAQIL